MSDAEEIIKRLSENHKMLALAESCTGGKAADGLVSVSGASNCFWGAYITYTIPAKIAMLGIDAAIIEKYGAVSSLTAEAMAAGALEKSGADYAAGVTGLAGPLGDGSENPVGAVWLGFAAKNRKPISRRFFFQGGRSEIRRQAVDAVLKLILENI